MMNLQTVSQGTTIDPTTRSGFLEIAGAFGRPAAHEARIAHLQRLLAESDDFRWYGERYRKAVRSAQFEAAYEEANPANAKLLRDSGIGY